MILVTGGAGFIGSNFILDWLAHGDEPVVNYDKLTYAGNLDNLVPVQHDARHIFVRGDISDRPLVETTLSQYRPRAIVHFAAETHVDRSIDGASAFVMTNAHGTFQLLEAVRHYWDALPPDEQAAFRFLHVSTDEVFGTLGPNDAPFTENSRFAPNNPYAASKAAADHLVRAWHCTYSLPTLTVNCSNNYGPRQYPEKLIPKMVAHALAGQSLPIYGDGFQIRDWLYVGDHCAALRRVLAAGMPGESYNIGGRCEQTNRHVIQAVCDLLDEFAPKAARGGAGSYRDQIIHVADRPGHDRRYAIDTGKIERELGWQPSMPFERGLRETVRWYLQHRPENAAVCR
ncbi:MAG: dTDP-glucose 4,6-dehydratase [Burkholderiaceae bacterium]|nr:dTDP-glucose 4,6-dehydratase [Burkholderiaceae bacterium]